MNDPDARTPLDDCWNRIGVRGDASCPELVRYVHCRNCPVHAQAAAVLLGGTPPPGYLAAWTRHVAEPKPPEEPDSRSAFLFRLGAEWFALPASVLVEVAEPRPLHSLPHRRGGMVLGLANIRGELLVCVSLAHLLKLDTGQGGAGKVQHDVARLLVAVRESCRVAFPADEVHGIVRYHPRQLQALPGTLSKAVTPYATALLPWREQRVGCLDAALLFHTLSRSLA